MPVTSYYSSDTRLNNKFGSKNVIAWSNRDGTTATADDTAIQAALDLADDQLDNFFRDGPYSIPLTPLDEQIRDWATTLAGYELYIARGQREDDPSSNGLVALRNKVMSEMARAKSGILRIPCLRRWPQTNAAIAV